MGCFQSFVYACSGASAVEMEGVRHESIARALPRMDYSMLSLGRNDRLTVMSRRGPWAEILARQDERKLLANDVSEIANQI